MRIVEKKWQGEVAVRSGREKWQKSFELPKLLQQQTTTVTIADAFKV
jgi:hypothetical protein